MLTNTGTGEKFTRGARLDTRDKIMSAFDRLPATVRHALANADHDWSVEQVTIALAGGNARLRIPALTAEQCVEMISRNDARRARAA